MTSYHPYGQQQVVSHPGFAVVPAFAPTRYAPSPVGHYHSNDVLLTPLYFKPLATVAPIDPALEFALSPTVESAQSPLLTDIERTASSDKKRKSDKKAVSICAVISSLKSVFARYPEYKRLFSFTLQRTVLRWFSLFFLVFIMHLQVIDNALHMMLLSVVLLVLGGCVSLLAFFFSLPYPSHVIEGIRKRRADSTTTAIATATLAHATSISPPPSPGYANV